MCSLSGPAHTARTCENFQLMRLLITLKLGIVLVAVQPLLAEELLPPDKPISYVIDHYISAPITEAGYEAAPVVDDALLIRRTTLDLAGRIPTTAEVREYVESVDPSKRVRLVDQLLSSCDFELHQRNEFDSMLSPDGAGEPEFREYLLTAVRENRPWDRMFREMMLGNSVEGCCAGADGFLKKRADSTDDMANDTSRLFFGVSINCAQCHDHPLVEDWKQDHYFGFKTFFSRTYLTKSNALAEKYDGEVKFKTTSGKEKQAAFMFLTGDVIEEPEIGRSKEQIKADDEEVKRQMKEKDLPPPRPPAFSPRSQLVELALKPENEHFFSRSIVNRIWARFLGRGLVDPLDQLHSGNSASHSELLDWLQRDLEARDYDLKPLIRGIVLSDTYARSSQWNGSGNAPWEGHFATFNPRPLMPRQYSVSLLLASRNPERLLGSRSDGKWREQREALERESERYAHQFELPTEHFQVSVDEALFFSNNERVQDELLRNADDRLVGHLVKLAEPQQQIQAAFEVVLCRNPDAAERTAFEEYLDERKGRPIEALQQIVWALMTSPELRFNY